MNRALLILVVVLVLACGYFSGRSLASPKLVTLRSPTLTGHLVLSTLHTNDSVSAITRLTDMGVEPFLLASPAQAVMAQGPVRTVCKTCPKPIVTPPSLWALQKQVSALQKQVKKLQSQVSGLKTNLSALSTWVHCMFTPHHFPICVP
jgi:Type II/IV secretion system protein